MRVISGKAKGARLNVPPGRLIRPATERLRESLFNILAPWVEGSTFLDLFAGSGAVGLEALSRGAAHVVFVEQAKPVLKVLHENIRRVCEWDPDFARRVELHASSVERMLSKFQGRVFDLIFLGPPYRETSLYEKGLAGINEHALLSRNGMMVVEQSSMMKLLAVPGLCCERTKQYGQSLLGFYRAGD